MLKSKLFAGDPILEKIADDIDMTRISRKRNTPGDHVRKVQEALLLWDPTCLPKHGADGKYGKESADAVHRFKRDELGVPENEIIDDVGPKTVQRLDAIALAHEKAPAAASVLSAELTGVHSEPTRSDVIVHTSGADAFKAFNDVLNTAKGENALVVLSGWDWFPDCPVDTGVTIGDALTAAAARGVPIRALFAHFPVIKLPIIGSYSPMPGNNSGSVAFVNALSTGSAIHDDQVLHHTQTSLGLPSIPNVGPIQLGIHHMKAWVVSTGERVVAWCGGIDFNKNRTGPTALHDVQVQVEGTAAVNVYEVLRNRWNDHPSRPASVTLPALSGVAIGAQRTRVITTFGDPRAHAGLAGGPYKFAPTGSTSQRQMVFHLLKSAQNFVYIEDQYLVDLGVAKEIEKHMSRLKAVIIVICDSNAVNLELHQAIRRRREFFDVLKPHMAKIAPVFRNNRFVHAKVWVFDDKAAVVTSANVNRRGYEHDSEIGLAFEDTEDATTVRDMRERLWALHLGPHAPAAGTDPVTTLPTWQSPPSGAPVTKFDPAVGTDPEPVKKPLDAVLNQDEFWNIVDPHCP